MMVDDHQTREKYPLHPAWFLGIQRVPGGLGCQWSNLQSWGYAVKQCSNQWSSPGLDYTQPRLWGYELCSSMFQQQSRSFKCSTTTQKTPEMKTSTSLYTIFQTCMYTQWISVTSRKHHIFCLWATKISTSHFARRASHWCFAAWLSGSTAAILTGPGGQLSGTKPNRPPSSDWISTSTSMASGHPWWLKHTKTWDVMTSCEANRASSLICNISVYLSLDITEHCLKILKKCSVATGILVAWQCWAYAKLAGPNYLSLGQRKLWTKRTSNMRRSCVAELHINARRQMLMDAVQPFSRSRTRAGIDLALCLSMFVKHFLISWLETQLLNFSNLIGIPGADYENPQFVLIVYKTPLYHQPTWVLQRSHLHCQWGSVLMLSAAFPAAHHCFGGQ